VADDYAKVMGGGIGSDTSRLQVLKSIAANQGPQQREQSLEGIREAVLSQTNSRIGKNPVMQRMYGQSSGSQPQNNGQQTPQIPPNASHIGRDANGNVVEYVVNGKYQAVGK
jgi:hypothetical protein